MMERLNELEPVFVEEMPKVKEHGKLYVSKEYGVAIHLCACGCGEQTVTPIGQIGTHNWTLTDNDGVVSLSPSVYNSQLPCKAHYFVKENKIQWCN